MRDILKTNAGAAVVQAATLTTSIVAARLLLPEGRGELAAIMIWIAAVATLVAFDVNRAIAHFTARESMPLARIVGTAGVLSVGAGMLGLVVGVGVVAVVFAAQPAPIRALAFLALAFVPLSMIGRYTVAILQGRRNFTAWNVIGVIAPLGYLALAVAFWAFGWVSVESFVVAFLVANALSVAVAAFTVLTSFQPSLKDAGAIARRFFGYSLPLYAATLVSFANQRLDQMFISVSLSTRDLGLYVVAMTVGTGVSILVAPIAQVAKPNIARQTSDAERAVTFGRYFRLALATALAAAAVLVIVGPALVPWLFGAAFAEAAFLARLAAIGAVGVAMRQVIGIGYEGFADNKPIVAAEILGAGLALLGLIVLLPLYGVVGAAFTFVGAQWAAMLLLLALMPKRLGIALGSVLRPQASDVAAVLALLQLRRRRRTS